MSLFQPIYSLLNLKRYLNDTGTKVLTTNATGDVALTEIDDINGVITKSQADLVENNPGVPADGYYLPIAIPEGKIPVMPPIIKKGSTETYATNVQLSNDFQYLVGFTDNATQTIKLKLL